ncbi:MAG TPA: WD40 repeat domain-containing protein, partial [Candidatus Acetothermia bacterium]|nr:WD40 repeat domain-containing protein [Candidatus Acetothermia bacterium]
MGRKGALVALLLAGALVPCPAAQGESHPNFPLGAVATLDLGWLSELAISPDGELLAIAALGKVEVFSFPDVEPMVTLDLPGGNAFSVAFSPDGENLAVGTFSAVHIWELSSQEISF